jgi:actin-related protein
MIGVTPESPSMEEPQEAAIHFPPLKFSQGMQVQSPVRNGIVAEWELLEKVWDYSLEQYLRTSAEGLPVLITEKAYTPFSLRHK